MTSSTTRPASPFKQHLPFETEDEAVFFGRDEEAAELTNRMLASRITILHAPSGAGKTSLLNARIIPNMERDGFLAIRVTPGLHPIESVKNAALRYILPPPSAEAFALSRAVSKLELDEHAPLASLFAAFNELVRRSPGDPTALHIIAPVTPENANLSSYGDDAPNVPWVRGCETVRPLLCRALAAMMEPTTTLAQWAFYADPTRASRANDFAGTEPSIAQALARLRSKTTISGYARIASLLSPASPGLLNFFRNLSAWLRVMRPSAQIVLILDQFEEVFLRFTEESRVAPQQIISKPLGTTRPMRDWRLRREFFAELESLYFACDLRRRAPVVESLREEPSSLLPMRFVVSLRDEYVGRLTDVRRFAPEVSNSTYRLDFLSPASAAAAVTGPSKRRGRVVDSGCVTAIIQSLVIEDSYVEPGPLQIVCDYLWRHEGPTDITVETLELELGGVPTILSRFFGDVLDKLVGTLTEQQSTKQHYAWSKELVRLEVLDIMSRLLTPSQTRNVVEKRYLTNLPLRSADRRDQLLDALEFLRLIRRESRPYGDFYEIAHEFMIAPIAAALGAFGFSALDRALAEIVEVGADATKTLSPGAFRSLNRHRRAFEWNGFAADAMFRASIVHAFRDPEGELDVRWWFKATQDAPASETVSLRAIRLSERALHTLRQDRTKRLTLMSLEERVTLFRSLVAAPALDTEFIQCVLKDWDHGSIDATTVV